MIFSPLQTLRYLLLSVVLCVFVSCSGTGQTELQQVVASISDDPVDSALIGEWMVEATYDQMTGECINADQSDLPLEIDVEDIQITTDECLHEDFGGGYDSTLNNCFAGGTEVAFTSEFEENVAEGSDFDCHLVGTYYWTAALVEGVTSESDDTLVGPARFHYHFVGADCQELAEAVAQADNDEDDDESVDIDISGTENCTLTGTMTATRRTSGSPSYQDE